VWRQHILSDEGDGNEKMKRKSVKPAPKPVLLKPDQSLAASYSAADLLRPSSTFSFQKKKYESRAQGLFATRDHLWHQPPPLHT
jgi:hypothetical protein